MRYLFLLVLLPFAALAQGIDWSKGACFDNGIWFPARAPMQCYSEDKLTKGYQNYPPFGVGNSPLYANSAGAVFTAPATGSTFITNSPSPKCPDGYSLVDADRPMCAKELIEPAR